MFENPFKKVVQEIDEVVDKVGDEMEEIIEDIRKPFYKRWKFWLVILFFVVIILVGIFYYSFYQPLKSSLVLAKQTQTYFEKVEVDLMAANFNQAKKDVQGAQQRLDKLQKNIARLDSPLLFGYLREQHRAVTNMVVATQEFSDSVYLLIDLIQDVLSDVPVQNGYLSILPAQRQQILEKFSQKTPKLNGAKAQVDLALLILDDIPVSKLNKTVSEYVFLLKDRMSILSLFLDKAISLSQTLPPIMGLNQEKTYLFLLQNNHELRPTGGFIGTLGIVKIKNGQITSFETDDVYDYDRSATALKVIPPEPIRKYLNTEGWYLRDSNWAADFVNAVQEVEKSYHREAGVSGTLKDYNIDGVIAITPKVVQETLGVIGAVDVDSFIFNKYNFIDRLQYLVEVGYKEQGLPAAQRKNIIGRLSQKIIDRTGNLSLNNWVEIVKLLFNNLNQKHILIFVKDKAIQQIIEQQNWAGRIKQTPDDYLLVVDANLASLKSNQCVTREIDYTLVTDENNNLIGTVDIIYQNNCEVTWQTSRYGTYTRAYVPQGSELLSTIGAMEVDRSNKLGKTDVTSEGNKTVFGAYISIEPGQRGILTFEYKLPVDLTNKVITGKDYGLYIQKQPGTLDDKLKVFLNLPKKIKAAMPAESKEGWGDNQYRLTSDLTEDREIKIGF